MKKYIFTAITALSAVVASAQELAPSDGLRYAMDNLNGTARFRGMSGAFGAVGGDMSAIHVNPAGGAIFNFNTAAATLNLLSTKSNSRYFGTTTNDRDTSFDLNQAGGIFVFHNQDLSSGWTKFTFGIAYDNANNFDNSFNYRGTGTRSIDQFFLNQANGLPVGVIDNNYRYDELSFQDQQAYLAYQTYLIDTSTYPFNPDNPNYVSNVPQTGSYAHQNYVNTNGYNGKLAFNFASSYKDRLYIGLNLNAHFTDYTKNSTVYESNNGPVNTDPNYATIRQIQFNNDMHTYGSGFSFNIGAIAKITDELRLGAAYESPTWYRLTDELSQSLYTTYVAPANSPTSPGATRSASLNPNIINVYPTYTLQTPGKFTGSLAYIFGKSGLISFDYGVKDYSNIKFKPNNSYNSSLNDVYKNTLTTAQEFRVGAEYKIKQVSLRGGYRFEESPYKDEKIVGDLKGYSAGIGYNFGSARLDFAYGHSQREMDVPLLSSMTDSARINSKIDSFTLTYTVGF